MTIGGEMMKIMIVIIIIIISKQTDLITNQQIAIQGHRNHHIRIQ